MANDNLKDMADKYDKRASEKRDNALWYFGGIIVLFLSTLAAVVFAEKVAELIIGGAKTIASNVLRKELEETSLWQGTEYYSIAIIRDDKTAAIAGGSGLIMISEGDRRSWIHASSNTEMDVYGIALSDDGRPLSRWEISD